MVDLSSELSEANTLSSVSYNRIFPSDVKDLTKEWMNVFRTKERKTRFVRCKICVQFPNVIKPLWKGRIPAIATTEGTRYQTLAVWKHHVSKIHKACTEALRRKTLVQENSLAHPIISAIKKTEENLYRKVLHNMYDVYNDSKRGTLSAWSWPSRRMARNAACIAENLKGEFLPYTPSLGDAQYTNPVHHRECLSCIADCGKEDLVKGLDQALAIAVKVDGHVDAYQTENKTVAVSYITNKGDLVTSFVSTEKPIERGARGMLGAVQNAFTCIGWSWEDNAKKRFVESPLMVKMLILGTKEAYGLCYKSNVNCSF